MTSHSITVVGAGIVGLWQALTLARAGHSVRLVEASQAPFEAAASRFAGAMLAPDCEAEAAPPIVRAQGLIALGLWRAAYPGLVDAGSLVLAAPRDRAELSRFARLTQDHANLDAAGVASLEPDLEGRYAAGLYFPHESHMTTPEALAHLLSAARAAGVTVAFGTSWSPRDAASDFVVDCRGLAARDLLPGLRGVRGERILVQTRDVTFSRPIRLLHPRHPLYVVPWSQGRLLIGATVIESEDAGPASVRSALELLGLAYALHPALGEAEILDVGAGVRPAFADNVPRVVVTERGRHIHVNGAYRHGFLLAPVLAEAVARLLAGDDGHPLVAAEPGSPMIRP